jgi:hypothetical protein
MKFFAAIVLGLILTSAAGVSAAEVGQREYIGDVRDRLISVEQGWGELGIDGCAHAPGQIPMPLRIKDTKYDRGLGHHAPGEIVVDLNGEYSRFEAKVGVQWQSGDGGTVVFQVFVDDVKRFDSGVMRERDQAKAVSIAVSGTRELRLVTGDSGDGINCDCADWADAFLIRATPPKPRASAEMLDIAPFARVITSDANRSDGVRAGRTQEIRADELFLDTDVRRATTEHMPCRPDLTVRAPSVCDGSSAAA